MQPYDIQRIIVHNFSYLHLIVIAVQRGKGSLTTLMILLPVQLLHGIPVECQAPLLVLMRSLPGLGEDVCRSRTKVDDRRATTKS